MNHMKELQEEYENRLAFLRDYHQDEIKNEVDILTSKHNEEVMKMADENY